ncbi:TPA: tail fiber domain-containing protein [Stenotrophomonas maltophilia]
MPVPQITITPAGFAAIVNAENTGTAPVKITQVGLTAQHFDVGAVGVTLPAEFKRLTTFGGKAVAPDTLHLNVRDDGTDTYTLRGFGLYLQDGTLFAVYSQPTPIMEKAAAATLLLATDIRFAKINATSIEVGDIDFINPPATTTQMGVVRLATEQEADGGSDPATAITPRGLARYINNRFGNEAPSVFVKSLLGLTTAALFRVQLGLKSAALRDEGHGNGLNADLLDGAHGDYYLDWKNFTGVPNRFTPAPHTHPIAEVEGLQPALDGKANRSGDTFTGLLAVNGAALRAYGWAGVSTNGLLMLGDHGSYIWKNGAYFEFANAAGGYNAVLSSGGTIWTSNNFNPGTKVSRAGDTMSGVLGFSLTPNANPDDARFMSCSESGASGEARRLDLCLLPGTGPTAREILFRGIQTTVFRFRCGSAVFEGGVSASGSGFNSGGAGAGYSMVDRIDFAQTWSNYVQGNTWRVWNNTNGIVFAVDRDGSVSAGGAYFGGSVRIQPAAADQVFIRSEGATGVTIDAVTGNNSAYAPLVLRGSSLSIACSLSVAGSVSVAGNITPSGGYDFGSSRKLKEITGPVVYGLEEVERMELATGHYKPEYNNDGRSRLFFVAEQLAELVPEAVDLEGVEFNGERVPSIKLDQLLPVLVKSIQQLAAEVRELRAER